VGEEDRNEIFEWHFSRFDPLEQGNLRAGLSSVQVDLERDQD
jgi:hypothetical protein